MTPPDAHEAAQKERRRREFLERCAVAFCSSGYVVGEVSSDRELQYVDANGTVAIGGTANVLAQDWSALWDALEADEQKRRETP